MGSPFRFWEVPKSPLVELSEGKIPDSLTKEWFEKKMKITTKWLLDQQRTARTEQDRENYRVRLEALNVFYMQHKMAEWEGEKQEELMAQFRDFLLGKSKWNDKEIEPKTPIHWGKRRLIGEDIDVYLEATMDAKYEFDKTFNLVCNTGKIPSNLREAWMFFCYKLKRGNKVPTDMFLKTWEAFYPSPLTTPNPDPRPPAEGGPPRIPDRDTWPVQDPEIKDRLLGPQEGKYKQNPNFRVWGQPLGGGNGGNVQIGANSGGNDGDDGGGGGGAIPTEAGSGDATDTSTPESNSSNPDHPPGPDGGDEGGDGGPPPSPEDLQREIRELQERLNQLTEELKQKEKKDGDFEDEEIPPLEEVPEEEEEEGESGSQGTTRPTDPLDIPKEGLPSKPLYTPEQLEEEFQRLQRERKEREKAFPKRAQEAREATNQALKQAEKKTLKRRADTTAKLIAEADATLAKAEAFFAQEEPKIQAAEERVAEANRSYRSPQDEQEDRDDYARRMQMLREESEQTAKAREQALKEDLLKIQEEQNRKIEELQRQFANRNTSSSLRGPNNHRLLSQPATIEDAPEEPEDAAADRDIHKNEATTQDDVEEGFAEIEEQIGKLTEEDKQRMAQEQEAEKNRKIAEEAKAKEKAEEAEKAGETPTQEEKDTQERVSANLEHIRKILSQVPGLFPKEEKKDTPPTTQESTPEPPEGDTTPPPMEEDTAAREQEAKAKSLIGELDRTAKTVVVRVNQAFDTVRSIRKRAGFLSEPPLIESLGNLKRDINKMAEVIDDELFVALQDEKAGDSDAWTLALKTIDLLTSRSLRDLNKDIEEIIRNTGARAGEKEPDPQEKLEHLISRMDTLSKMLEEETRKALEERSRAPRESEQKPKEKRIDPEEERMAREKRRKALRTKLRTIEQRGSFAIYRD